MDGKFDATMDGKFDTPIQGIAPIPFHMGGGIGNTASTPETSAVRKLSFAATREVFESKPSGRPSGRPSERFPLIQQGDTANSSRIRVAKNETAGQENEDALPKSSIQKYLNPQVAAPRRKTVGSSSGYGLRRVATPAPEVTASRPSAPSSLVPRASQLPRAPKDGNARLVPPKNGATPSSLGSSRIDAGRKQ